jgi:hypothetical protein
MAKGWRLEPGRHALAAKGVPTGHKEEYLPVYRMNPPLPTKTEIHLAKSVLEDEVETIIADPQSAVSSLGWNANLTQQEKHAVSNRLSYSKEDVEEFADALHTDLSRRHSTTAPDAREALSDLRRKWAERKLKEIIPRL